MSGLRDPIGDEPPQTYWRRRLIVVGVAVLLVLLLWFLITATLAGDGEGAQSSPDATPDSTLSPAAPAADSSDPDRPCTAADLAITTAASPAKPAVGSSVAFDVTMEHTGGSACSLSSGSEGTSMVVGSGPDDVYYDSGWCTDTPVFEEASWILQPGDRQVVQSTWNTKRHNQSCESGSNGGAGTYWVDIAVAGVDAEQARFELVG